MATLPYTKGYISVNAVNAVRLGGFDPTQPYITLHRPERDRYSTVLPWYGGGIKVKTKGE